MARANWSDAQIAAFARDIEKQYGKHWAYIPETLRDPIISHHVLGIVTGLDRDAIDPKDIAELYRRLHEKVFGKGDGKVT